MNSHNFKKILVPVDFSQTASRAVEHAALLARKNSAEIILLHVLDNSEKPAGIVAVASNGNSALAEEVIVRRHKQLDTEIESEEEFSVRELAAIVNKLKKENVTVAEPVLEKGKVSKKINEVAKEVGADIIFMGTHGAAGFREFVAGSNTFKVVSEAKCPVFSVREEVAIPGFKTIVLPFMDRPHMREHVDYAIALAKIYNATLDVLGIDTEMNTSHFTKIKLEAEQIKRMADHAGIKCNVDVYPASYLNDFIMGYSKNKRADLLVVMADLNKLSVSQYFKGPVVQQIVNHSQIPVLSIPPTYNPKIANYEY